MPKIKAAKNPSTSNPFTIEETSKIIPALIIKVKSPKVKILIGKVKTTKIGFIVILIKPKNKATQRADQRDAIATLGIKYAPIITAKEVINNFKIIFI